MNLAGIKQVPPEGDQTRAGWSWLSRWRFSTQTRYEVDNEAAYQAFDPERDYCGGIRRPDGLFHSPGAMLNTAGLPGHRIDIIGDRPSRDGPVEDRVKQAIEEVNREGQAALEDLGELDSPEKVDRAGQILERMERATREVKKRAHDRVSEQFDELNDLAAARLQVKARADLRELGQLGSAEKRQRAEQIRARVEQRQEQLADQWSQLRERL